MASEPIRIALYNHKGGVGKTTLTINIASALCKAGKRVLLVDSDPQCNLTAYLIDEKYVDKLLDESDSANGRTIWTALKPIVEAEGNIHQIAPIETAITGLSLVPGDIRLAEFEACLNEFWADCLQRRARGYRGISSLNRVVTQAAAAAKADYIFYDTGPNIGPLNRIILLDVDYFIVPVACDLFSLRALKSLGQSLRNWIIDWQTISKFAPDNVSLVDGSPRFMGYIPQQFRTYGGQIIGTAVPFLSKLERRIFSEVVKVLNLINKDLAPSTMTGTKLGEIKSFGSLIQQAQEQGVPLWKVEGGAKYQKEEAADAFDSIARAILRAAAKHR